MLNSLVAELPEPLLRRPVLLDRRRPGRVAYQDPAFIALLRNPAAARPAADTADAAGQREPPRNTGHQEPRRFTITDFDKVRPRPGKPSGASQQVAEFHPQSVELAVARAERYCRDDRYSLEWKELLAGEVEKIQSFLGGDQYPGGTPTDASINALTATLVTLSGPIRRLCLICGRDGTPEANRSAAEAIRSLGCRAYRPGEYSYWYVLRGLCASLCFYWAIAGAIARHDFTTARGFMHARISRNGSEETFISALPLLALGSIEWKVLKGYEERRTPASDFLFHLFRTEIADAALDPGEAAEDLFDRLELLITLEFAHARLRQIAASKRPLWFWTPLGRYVCNLGSKGLVDRLAALENLPVDHALLRAGLLGGAPASAVEAARAVRQMLDPDHRCAARGAA
jgi:hypothetical protein